MGNDSKAAKLTDECILFSEFYEAAGNCQSRRVPLHVNPQRIQKINEESSTLSLQYPSGDVRRGTHFLQIMGVLSQQARSSATPNIALVHRPDKLFNSRYRIFMLRDIGNCVQRRLALGHWIADQHSLIRFDSAKHSSSSWRMIVWFNGWTCRADPIDYVCINSAYK